MHIEFMIDIIQFDTYLCAQMIYLQVSPDCVNLLQVLFMEIANYPVRCELSTMHHT